MLAGDVTDHRIHRQRTQRAAPGASGGGRAATTSSSATVVDPRLLTRPRGPASRRAPGGDEGHGRRDGVAAERHPVDGERSGRPRNASGRPAIRSARAGGRVDTRLLKTGSATSIAARGGSTTLRRDLLPGRAGEESHVVRLVLRPPNFAGPRALYRVDAERPDARDSPHPTERAERLGRAWLVGQRRRPPAGAAAFLRETTRHERATLRRHGAIRATADLLGSRCRALPSPPSGRPLGRPNYRGRVNRRPPAGWSPLWQRP